MLKTKVEINKELIDKLYANYKTASLEDIKKYLDKYKIAYLTDMGLDSMVGYYPYTKEVIENIKEKPRNISTTFSSHELEKRPIKNLVPIKDVVYLVKSSSRFFLKPDIGEVFDQMKPEDFKGLHTILLHKEYIEIDGTGGEHFLMLATLLKKNK